MVRVCTYMKTFKELPQILTNCAHLSGALLESNPTNYIQLPRDKCEDVIIGAHP